MFSNTRKKIKDRIKKQINELVVNNQQGINAQTQLDVLSKVPVDIWKEIFSHLDAISLLKMSLVCKQWREISSADVLWKRLSHFSKQAFIDEKKLQHNLLQAAKNLYATIKGHKNFSLHVYLAGDTFDKNVMFGDTRTGFFIDVNGPQLGDLYDSRSILFSKGSLNLVRTSVNKQVSNDQLQLAYDLVNMPTSVKFDIVIAAVQSETEMQLVQKTLAQFPDTLILFAIPSGITENFQKIPLNALIFFDHDNLPSFYKRVYDHIENIKKEANHEYDKRGCIIS